MTAQPSTDMSAPVFPPMSVERSRCYFLSLRVENLRCFGQTQKLHMFDKTRPQRPARWTIILGENGSGKSTLLQSVALSKPCKWSDPSGPRYSFQIATSKSWRRHELLAKDEASTVRISVDLDVQYDDGPKEETISCSLGSDRAWTGERESVYKGEHLPATPCFAYGSQRHSVGVSVGTAEDWGEGDETLFSNDVRLRDPTDIIVEKALAGSLEEAHEQGSSQHMDNGVELSSMLASVLPDIEKVRIELRHGRAAVLFDSPFGRVHFSQLSDGYRATAAWVADLFARMYEAYPDSENPLEEPAIVLVDEFDLHMHPRWQRDMIAFLTERFPATQFIVTAHSPLIVQSAPDANVVVLRREGDHVVIDNDPPDVSGWRVDQILTSELFGLESARSTKVQAALDERRALVSRDDLTDEERARLSELDEVAAELPYAESHHDIRAMNLIKKMTGEVDG